MLQCLLQGLPPDVQRKASLDRETAFCGIKATCSTPGKIGLDLQCASFFVRSPLATARLAQSAERKALNLVVVGSSPTVGVFLFGLAHCCAT